MKCNQHAIPYLAGEPLPERFFELAESDFESCDLLIIMGTSLLFFGMYFPEHGGMLFKKGALGNYDPQLYKPVDGERGADQMDYSKTKNTASEVSSVKIGVESTMA